MCPLICRFFNKLSTINEFPFPYDFPNNVFFSVAYFIMRIPNTYSILSVRG